MRMKRIIPFILAIVILLATPMSVSAAISNEAQEHIISQLQRANVPNAAVAVIRGGETSHILKDSDYDTLFEIGSVAKTFTAFGVLVLEEMGLLSITDPINMHLPWFGARYNGEPVPYDDIRIYNFLQHTSGFTHEERHFPAFPVETADEFISLYTGIELAFYPSAKHSYSNANYILLGLLIEAVSGLSYDEFMTKYVLHPLGLYNTFASIENAHATGRAIGGHRRAFFMQTSVDLEYSSILIPSGHIYSNITDMTRWAEIHLGLVDVPEMFESVMARSHEYIHSANPFSEFDFHHTVGGWLAWENNGTIEHNGGTPGYFAVLRMFHANDSAIVVLGNLGIFPVTINSIGDIVTNAALHSVFDNVGIDFYVILDIVLNVAIIWGVFSLYKFIRLLISTKKRIRDGAIVEYSGIKVKWIFDLVFAVAILLAIYVVLPNILGLSAGLLIAIMPINLLIAIVFAWFDLAHSLFGLWTKVFVNSQKN